MKAVFALFLIVAIIGMAMAGVHHYRIPGNGGGQAAPAPTAAAAPDSAQGGGFFKGLADDVNGFFG